MKRYILPIALTSLFFSAIHAQHSTLELNVRGNDLKNIALVANFGGASHYNWVLNIVDELGARGHNTTFITNSNAVRFGQPYSHVKTVSLGPVIHVDPSFLIGSETARNRNLPEFFAAGMDVFFQHFEKGTAALLSLIQTSKTLTDYEYVLQYFRENNIDLAICDHFAEACFEVSEELNIPYIVTAAIDIFPDSSAPYVNNKLTDLHDFTTEDQSFRERFYNKFIVPLQELYYFYPVVQKINDRKKAMGIPLDTVDRSHDKSLKLINNLFGFSPAKPTGSHTEFVGPIMPKQYKPLTAELQSYLDNHKRVAYIAFGQMATPNEKEITLLLTALLENWESGSIDGLLWATVNAAGYFPDTVTTASGTTYQVQDLFNGIYPDIHLVKWAPQTAVLMHPSTTAFISHGGLGSWYESMYTGTRMIMFPFFGDQPANALIIERNHLGGILDYDFTPEQAASLIKKVVDDKDGEISRNVKRFQALVQIHSEHGVIRGADLVEEVAYTNVDGKLPHRESADRRMSYVKSHNIDLYAALVGLLYAGFRVVLFAFKHLFASTSKSSAQKVKQH